MEHLPHVHYPVLVPNQKGLDLLISLLDNSATQVPLSDEISIFTAATEAFTKANLNMTISESLMRLETVAKAALDRGLRVRGYVSVVIACPYSGKVDHRRVREIAKALVDMGCYEVSLGDTVGQGTPCTVAEMIEEVKKSVPVENLAVSPSHPAQHPLDIQFWSSGPCKLFFLSRNSGMPLTSSQFHDTYGTGVANVFAALARGIRTIDSAIGGLGGCPYSPGATGNVATEDVLYALQGSRYKVAGSHHGTVDLAQMVDIGWWISQELGKQPSSRVNRAIRARRLRDAKGKE